MSAVAAGPASREALLDLPLHEAALLDEARYDEWLALFAADGLYWVPLSRAQTDPAAGQSIAAEDRLLLAIRIERLRSPKAHSMHPAPACQHVLQMPRVVASDAAANRHETRTPFVYVEARGEDQIVLAGTVTHTTRVEKGVLRIVTKRVDLVNAGAALPAVFLFL